MSTSDHATGAARDARRFRPAAGGGRVGTGSSRPLPTTERFPDPGAAGGGTAVGVIDTGIAVRDGRPHPYLVGRVDFDPVRDVEPDPAPDPPYPAEFGHGSFVAGLILREAPGCRVVMRRGLLDAAAAGQDEDVGVASAITDLLASGIRLINLSFTGQGVESATPEPIVAALLAAAEVGAVVVAAVSNDPTAASSFPAQLANPDGDHPELAGTVLAVIAGDESMRRKAAPDELLDDGNAVPEPPTARFGWQPPEDQDWLRCRANGVAVLGPYPRWGRFEGWDGPFDGWARWSGCSFAAAQFTGFLAHETQVRSAATPGITPLEVARSLKLFDRAHYHYAKDSTWLADPDRA